MRSGIVHVVFGLALVAGGYAADLYFNGFYWIGAYVVGGIEIVRGIVMVARVSRMR
jgi:hypothetical protein